MSNSTGRDTTLPIGDSINLPPLQIVNICATAASSQDLASALVCGWMAVSIFITPFHNRFEAYTLGWGMSWLRFFSPINWAWQGSLGVELGGRYFDCAAGSGLPALGIMPGKFTSLWGDM